MVMMIVDDDDYDGNDDADDGEGRVSIRGGV